MLLVYKWRRGEQGKYREAAGVLGTGFLSPVSRIVGKDVRDIPYDREQNSGGLHWWTFLSAYMEIGDCLFSQIVRVCDQRARGKKLDKAEEEWYRRNRHLVDFQQTFTDAEDTVLRSWGAK